MPGVEEFEPPAVGVGVGVEIIVVVVCPRTGSRTSGAFTCCSERLPMPKRLLPPILFLPSGPYWAWKALRFSYRRLTWSMLASGNLTSQWMYRCTVF